MYVPEHFAENSLEALHDHIGRFGFATLVSDVSGAPFATHLPLLLDPERGPQGTLLGHMARPNPQWEGFDGTRKALAIFHGPHAYISPAWYPVERAVPTWNYAVVHACGAPRLVEDPVTVRTMMEELVAVYEGGKDEPWTMARPGERYIEGMLKGIAAFEIPLDRIECKFKLNQNHPEANRAGAIAGLRAEDRAESHAVADMMEAASKSG